MTRRCYHSPEKANIGGERNCHSFRGLCRGGSVPFPYSGNSGLTASSRRRMMVCREVPNSRATALIQAPAFRCSSAACRWAGFSAGGRPNHLPATLVLARPLNPQSLLKLCHRRNDLHGHLAGRAGMVRATQHEAVYETGRFCTYRLGIPQCDRLTHPPGLSNPSPAQMQALNRLTVLVSGQ